MVIFLVKSVICAVLQDLYKAFWADYSCTLWVYAHVMTDIWEKNVRKKLCFYLQVVLSVLNLKYPATIFHTLSPFGLVVTEEYKDENAKIEFVILFIKVKNLMRSGNSAIPQKFKSRTHTCTHTHTHTRTVTQAHTCTHRLMHIYAYINT